MNPLRPLTARITLLAAAVAVVGLVTWAGLTLWHPPTLVATAVAEVGPLRITIDEDGLTRPRDFHQIITPVGGQLQPMTLRQGDAVAAGQVVATLRPNPLTEEDRKQLASQVASTAAAMKEAEQFLRRREADVMERQRQREAADLQAAGRPSRLLERARQAEMAALGAAQSAWLRASLLRSQLQTLKAAQALGTGSAGGLLELRAPAFSHVLRPVDTSERLVSPGTPLLALGNPQRIEVAIDVLAQEASRVSPGMMVELGDWGGEGVLKAQVRVTEPTLITKATALGGIEQRLRVVADIAEPPLQLRDGYRVDASIVIWQSDRVVKVPAGALIRVADQWRVFVLADDRLRETPVRPGHRNINEVEIEEGLNAGDVVVLSPGSKVRHGQRAMAQPVRAAGR